MSGQNEEDFENLIRTFAGKTPVEIFELLFDDTLQNHIVAETVRYANSNNEDLNSPLMI